MEKNAPLKAEWKLTPAPKWPVESASPSRRPPTGSRAPPFLKGGLGISVGVVSPRPPPPLGVARPGPLLLLARRGGGAGAAAETSGQRHTRHPASGAGIAPAPHAAQPTPTPVISFFPWSVSACGTHVREETAGPTAPVLGPTGCGPGLRRRRGTCARVGLAEITSARPSPRLRRPPSRPPVAEAGRARAAARSGQGLCAGRPRRASELPRARVGQRASPGAVNGTDGPAAGRPRPLPTSRSWGLQATPEIASFSVCLT